mmetsp:Transcript_40839/g.64776  ORF Transcript_40839/g.64776 Transcript_40839/m.64776 type:complete len:239 (-) Transcript_40839:149-865(-)
MDAFEQGKSSLCRIGASTLEVEIHSTSDDDESDGISHMNSEPAAKRTRCQPATVGTDQGRASAEPELVTPEKQSYSTSMSRTFAASTNLQDEQIIELILALLRKKGDCVAKLIQQRVANGQGAFLFKKDQFIAASLLDKALKQWRSLTCAVSEQQNASGTKDKSEPFTGKGQTSCTSTCAESLKCGDESPVKMSYADWKQCAKFVECGMARDIHLAARTMRAARGDLKLAAAMLLAGK